MANNIIPTLTKSLAAKIVWIGGAAAGLTALFSALGFLVLKGHQDLLGISGLVPTKADSWTIEGAKCVYSSVYLLFAAVPNRLSTLLPLFAGTLLLIVFAPPIVKRLGKFREAKPTGLARLLLFAFNLALIIISLALLIGGIVLMLEELKTSNLLIEPSAGAYQQQIKPRSTVDGMQDLAFQYAGYAMFVAFLAIWLKLLPQFLFSPPAKTEEVSAASKHPLWLHGLWGLFLIHLLLLPILYGQLVKGYEYFKVCLLPEFEASGAQASACAGQEGWLLYKGADELVVYMPKSAATLQVLKQKEFKQLQVLAYGNLMAAVPSPTATNPPSAAVLPPGSALAQMAQFLQNIPDSLAAGIKPLTRTIRASQRTLVLADKNGEARDTFTPFADGQNGSIRSPIFLSEGREIVYVEVVNNTPRLKVITLNNQFFDSGSDRDFGDASMEGWEPQLAPDGRSIIFRQGQTKLVRIELEGDNPTVLLEDPALNKLLGVFPGEDEQNYWLLYSKYQDNTLNYWTAEVRAEQVTEQQLDGEDWELAGTIRIHQGRLLYEQEEVMTLVLQDDRFVLADEESTERVGAQTQKIFNVYLGDSLDAEGTRISNTRPGAAPTHNRYPAWSPDGSAIVYLSGEM